VRDLHRRSALALAALIRRREVSVEEVTRHYLQRIAAADAGPDGPLGAFVELRPERAVTCARRLDRDLARDPSAERGRLFGLPTALKDLHFTRGFYTRAGSRAFRWLWSPFDDVTSRAVRRAGLVILGKLATSELAIMPVVETDLHPPTRNPWDRAHSAGGSSGGSGAAVAAGLLPLAAASDGAGSIRIPAAFCGLVGHKPTRGLVPNPFARVEPLLLSVVGPLARDVDDAAALLDLLTDRDRPERRASSFLARAQVPPPPLCVGYTCDAPFGHVDPAAVAAIARVVAALATLGHRVAPAPPLSGSFDEFLPIFAFLAKNATIPAECLLQPATRWLRERGRAVTFDFALSRRELFAQRARDWLRGFDLCVTPTVACGPPLVGAWRGLDGARTMEAAAHLGVFTAAFNASGQPAVSVPVRVPGHALPLGVQLVAHAGDDARLLACARAVMILLGPAPAAFD